MQLVVLPGFAIAGPAFVNSLVPSTWLPKLTRYWGLGLGVPLALFALMGPDDAINPSYSVFHIHLIGSMAGTLAHVAIESWRGDRLARWVLAAFLMVFATGVHDLLLAQGIFPRLHFHLYLWVSGLYCDAVGPLSQGLCRGSNAGNALS